MFTTPRLKSLIRISKTGLLFFALNIVVAGQAYQSLWNGGGSPSVTDNYWDPVELGLKFQVRVAGQIQAISFYKATNDTQNSHAVHLWSASGTLLAIGQTTSETASGWQVASLSSPIYLQSNTTYVASYYSSAGHYAYTLNAFLNAYSSGAITALASQPAGPNGPNGVYLNCPGASPGATICTSEQPSNGFPTKFYEEGANYWVDVQFVPFQSLWNAGGSPSVTDNSWEPVELGLKFQAGVPGQIQAISFYKATNDTQNSHAVHLWSTSPGTASSGTLLATGQSTSETASGWQTVELSRPVAVEPNVVYVASYYSSAGYYAFTPNAFPNAYSSGSITALASQAAGPNGVYLNCPGASPGATICTSEQPSNGFPTKFYQAGANYWVDVQFVPSQSLWNGGGSPSVTDHYWEPVELGLKFQVKVPGEMAISFYKATNDTQNSHAVHLWSASGQLLTTGQSTLETASGWQVASLSSPIYLQPNTTYVASYYSSAGYYAYTPNAFPNAYSSGAITALASQPAGPNGPNGVYLNCPGASPGATICTSEQPSNGFPTKFYDEGANYWVDVQFVPLLGVVNGHVAQGDPAANGELLPWLSLRSTAAAAENFLVNSVPPVSASGQVVPAYFLYPYMSVAPSPNPVSYQVQTAGFATGLIEAGIAWNNFASDPGLLNSATSLVRFLLTNDLTNSTDRWPTVPYATSSPGTTSYDGNEPAVCPPSPMPCPDYPERYVLEPDKIGELGYWLLKLYEQSPLDSFSATYLSNAIHFADVLASNMNSHPDYNVSPWPFRVRAADGFVKWAYTANALGPIRLFDELISLGKDPKSSYAQARSAAWSWLMNFPLKNNKWANYYEDFWGDDTNINGYTPLEVARYLLENPSSDANYLADATNLFSFVEGRFGVPGPGNSISVEEQDFYPVVTADATARYARVAALLAKAYGVAGQPSLSALYQDKSLRAFNFCTYMLVANNGPMAGQMATGPDIDATNTDLTQINWFRVGYTDFIQHLVAGMTLFPAWAAR